MSKRFELNGAFAAIADPTRRAILGRLALGEASVSELAEPFEMTQPAISQHLKVLEDAGLISTRVEGARRPRRLESAGIDAMDEWLGKLRKSLETSYGRLDEVLAAMETAAEIETGSGTEKVKRKEKGGGKGKGKGKKKRKKEKHK